jgi:hypothetical protein
MGSAMTFLDRGVMIAAIYPLVTPRKERERLAEYLK